MSVNISIGKSELFLFQCLWSMEIYVGMYREFSFTTCCKRRRCNGIPYIITLTVITIGVLMGDRYPLCVHLCIFFLFLIFNKFFIYLYFFFSIYFLFMTNVTSCNAPHDEIRHILNNDFFF
ncbi:hypothetical protein H8356DRAFT_197541 [Neocallimastix lanati (nom. inval.)]|nr:hypothetical protein H8356DRAFT_197541 [Neocallimastix sp. JGI-2020a]